MTDDLFSSTSLLVSGSVLFLVSFLVSFFISISAASSCATIAVMRRQIPPILQTYGSSPSAMYTHNGPYHVCDEGDTVQRGDASERVYVSE